MKSIGIVTFFKSYNYGVWLQAYATQKFFENEGYEAQIINYANKLENQTTKYSFKENNKLYGYITSFIKSILFGKVTYYKKGFGRHLHEYYNLTPIEYTDVTQMNNLEYDVLIAGSDQLWNPRRTYDKLDPVFLLQFGKCSKRMSLSTSLGSDPVRNADKEALKTAFSRFNAISVRENFAKNELQELTNLQIKVTADPTFLLKKEDWLSLASTSIIKDLSKEGYILTYFVSAQKRSERYYSIINSYSKKMGLPVLAIQFSRAKSTPADKVILGASIADFLNLLNNSRLMITDSFHGVALSVNLEKEFIAIENRDNPERVRQLLAYTGLENRIDLQINKYFTIDYLNVLDKINVIREDTRNWINESLND